MAKFVIEVRTKGFAVAKSDLKETARQSRAFAREANNAAGSSAIFRREVSKLRNNMLLYSFAIAGAIRVMASFFRASMEFEKTKARLEGLTGSAQAAAETFEIFNEAAKKTQFGIQQITAAGAQLEAFGINSKATIRILSDLASFMGRDISTAAFAMGRAFSAGAAASEIFREAGVLNIIKTSQGIEDLTKLTLPEFRVAMMKTFTDAGASIKGSTERIQKTTEGMIMNLKDEFEVLQAEIGDKFIPTLKGIVTALTTFIKALDSRNISIFAANVGVLTVALKINAIGWQAATTSAATFFTVLGGFIKRLAVLTWMNFVAFELVRIAENFGILAKKTDEATDSMIDMNAMEREMIANLERATEATNDAVNAEEALKESIEKSELALSIKLATMLEDTEIGKARVRVYLEENRMLTMNEIELYRQIAAINNKNRIEKEAQKAAKERADARAKADKEQIRLKEQLIALEERQRNSLINLQQEQVVLNAELAGATEVEIQQLQNLNDFYSTLADNVSLTAGQKSLAIDMTKSATDATQLEGFTIHGLSDANKELLESIKAIFMTKAQLIDQRALEDASLKNNKNSAKDAADQNMKLAQSITLAAGAMKQMGDSSMTAEQKLSSIMSTIGSLLMLMPSTKVAGSFLQAGSMFVGHTGGLIGNSGIQRFAKGGMVQGQDNVPIMAQAGEFIIKRDAVQNIGIENLHAMNQSGTAPVTVNINGGIVQEDFVRNELMPQINKSIKNGLA